MKISSSLVQCCMCGDSGITRELFRCKICHFRSQHRYCSNLYPKSVSYKVCNWCLNQKEDSKEKSQNSLNSSASFKSKTEDDGYKSQKKDDNNQRNSNDLKQRKLMKNPINKPDLQEKLSPRKKVRRYKLLEEVST
ncbi:hypothetical protein like AT3G60520 [Hibiscus trionum]|nr:hypothetical protein like AT3G60520 [Hibiscus trionum]